MFLWLQSSLLQKKIKFELSQVCHTTCEFWTIINNAIATCFTKNNSITQILTEVAFSLKKKSLKPGSYFLPMRSEFYVNLTSQLSFRSDIHKWVERSWTTANIRCDFCDNNIRFAFAFAGSMNRASQNYWLIILILSSYVALNIQYFLARYVGGFVLIAPCNGLQSIVMQHAANQTRNTGALGSLHALHNTQWLSVLLKGKVHVHVW